ncbi:MAG: ferritin-like domain-containing protein [Gemmatimonadales bacterium]
MAFETMQELLIHQLRDIYSAEQMLVKALPKMQEKATSEDLATAFQEHLTETESHVARLDQVFELLGERSGGVKCKGMQGLVEEAEELLDEDGTEAVIDAGIIAAAQRVEHYEISAYGSAKAFATLLGLTDIAELLNETQLEETAADKKLSLIATAEVNARAAGTDPSMAAKG